MLIVSLSCSLPGQEVAELQGINSVSVTPPSGPGNFSAVVQGEAFNGKHTLSCYVAPDRGDNKFTKTVSGDMSHLGYKTFGFNESFNFMYTVSRNHTLVCLIDDQGLNSWSADFTVDSGSQPPAATQPPVGQSLSPDQFKTVTLSYLSFKNQTDASKGGPPYWCFTGDVSGGSPISPLNIAPNGAITGECKGTFKSGSISVSYAGTTSGQWDLHSGVVSWKMDMTIHQDSGPYSSTRTLEIHDVDALPTASAGEVSATGTAAWSDSCRSADSNHPYCAGTQASYDWSGTLDWKMTFNP